MKNKMLFVSLMVGAALAASGCYSEVRTFDGAGNPTGLCRAENSVGVGTRANCYGYANPGTAPAGATTSGAK